MQMQLSIAALRGERRSVAHGSSSYRHRSVRQGHVGILAATAAAPSTVILYLAAWCPSVAVSIHPFPIILDIVAGPAGPWMKPTTNFHA
jgi:hypothetical protein